MTIGIDGTPTFGERAIKRYTIELINNLLAIDTENLYKIFYIAYHKEYLNQINLPNKENVKKIITRIPGRVLNFLWNNFNLPKIEYFTHSLDIFHATDFIPPPVKHTKIIFTLHGLIPLIVPHLFNKKYVDNYIHNLKIAIKRASFFIAVSETTKKEFLEYHKIDGDRVCAIPLGVSEEFKVYDKDMIKEELRNKLNLNTDYILYCGVVAKHKNIDGVIEAWKILHNKYKIDINLVLAGPVTIKKDEIYKRVGEKLTKRIIFTGYIAEGSNLLSLLYNGTSLFASLSFYEGFASPPLEAMKCGIPTIVSNVSSLPETTGDAAILVNPNNYEEIADAMYRVLTDNNLREDLIKKGLRWASQFTWRRCAQQTLKFYREIYSW